LLEWFGCISSSRAIELFKVGEYKPRINRAKDDAGFLYENEKKHLISVLPIPSFAPFSR
jgi:hypothetical protein